MFASGDAFFQHKTPVSVRVELADASPAEGYVFLAIGDRLSDLLNDPRPFFPLRRSDGKTVIVAKKYVISICERAAIADQVPKPAPNSEPKTERKSCPYSVLHVSPDASMEEIRASCRTLTEEILPSGVTSANAGDPKLEPALRAAKKILKAYKAIMKERAAQNAGAPEKVQGTPVSGKPPVVKRVYRKNPGA